MGTLIAEDLLLLLLDDDSGTLSHSDKIQPLLGGALLIELALAERIEVADRTSRWRQALVAVVDGPPVDEPLLAAAIGTIGEKPRSAQDLVNRLGKGTRDVLLERLDRARARPAGARARCSACSRARPGPPPTARTRPRCASGYQGALVHSLTPDARTSALVALLSAVGHAHKVVERGDVPVKDVKSRAKEIADGAWAAKAVKDAVAAAQAAMTAAVVASTAAATAAGS